MGIESVLKGTIKSKFNSSITVFKIKVEAMLTTYLGFCFSSVARLPFCNEVVIAGGLPLGISLVLILNTVKLLYP